MVAEQVGHPPAAGQSVDTGTAGSDEVFLLPASWAQERLWFLDRLTPGSPLFNIPAAFRLRGRLDAGALAAACAALAARHETLRTTLAVEDGEKAPRQVVAAPPAEALPVADLTALPPGRREAEALARAGREAVTPFDLRRGPLARFTLLRLAADDHLLLVTLHHAVADGWSLGVLQRELGALYAAAADGREAALPELPIQYGDYAAWQRETLTPEVLERRIEGWRRRLDGAPQVLELPGDRPRPAVQSHRGGHAERRLPRALAAALEARAPAERATPYMVLSAAFAALLHHATHRRDLVLGAALANRPSPELEGVIGFFANTLPLRLAPVGAESFRRLLGRVRDGVLDLQAEQDLPFDRLVEALRPQRDPAHNPLLQVMFLLEEGGAEAAGALALPGISVEAVPVGTRTAKYDLALTARRRGGTLVLAADYAADLFDRATVARLLAAYETVLAAALEQPEHPVADLPTLSPAARHQLVTEWNDTAAPLPAGRCLHHGFAEQARRRPAAPAVVTSREVVTYGDLAARVDRLAARLRARGVGPGVLVGVHLERSPRMVEAVLAVLAAGGAYVPLEADWPAERIAWIVGTHRVRVVLAEAATRGRLARVAEHATAERPFEIVSLTTDTGTAAAAAGDQQPAARRQVLPDDLAYIIFTSGSTGRPKGVMVRHRAAVNLVEWVNRTFAVGPADRLLFVTPLSFDLSVYDVFGTLAAGASIRLAEAAERADPQRLVTVLREEPVTFWNSAPAALQQLVPYLARRSGPAAESPQAAAPEPALRLVFLSGDWIPLRLPATVRAAFPGASVVSLGGATEATVWSNYHRVAGPEPDWPSIPYGRPIRNARYHVLDPRLRPCPVGVPGDLYIAGPCLSAGYAAAARQTAAQYRPDPFAAAPGGRAYCTGDRARYRHDGRIEFLGRLDTQVKVRGYRIELGEIEAVVARHRAVGEAVVLVREDTPGNQRLVAYVRPEGETGAADLPAGSGTAGLERELTALAARHLPGYMLPAAWVVVERWPLSPTGKLDRKALPAPAPAAGRPPAPPSAAQPEAQREQSEDQTGTPPGTQAGTQPGTGPGAQAGAGAAADPAAAPQPPRASPQRRAEHAIAAVWADVLGSNTVDPETSFFDQGGTSLTLAEVHVRLQQVFGRDIPMVDLFRYPTVTELAAELAEAVAEEAADQDVAGEPASEPAPPPRGGREVAIVGMAGRFPGAASIAELWQRLAAGEETVSRFDDDELLAHGADPGHLAHPRYVKARGALDGHDLFDAELFGLSPREAQILDPQHRLFLECAWQALEDAGYPPPAEGLRVGVFAGAGDSGYGRALSDDAELAAAVGRFQIGLANRADYLPTRVSYELDLTGPAVDVQTACSTSLVAVHLARLALLNGDCDLALAGGVAVQLHERRGYFYLDAGIDSPDGHTRAFDAAAAGMVAGSGAGVVVLKRLADAVADGDTIHAVLRGSAINNDGGRKMGFTAPSAEGQEKVIRAALADAGVDAATVGYVEAHGTGTRLGDTIEVAGLNRAFGGDLPAGSCLLGSVKTNVGHLDAAAGVTGLIKAVLALEHGRIPPSLHCTRPNPEIDFAAGPFRVASALCDWPARPEAAAAGDGGAAPRRAGVSSFGIGGTNAHVVLEEAPSDEEGAGPARAAQVLTVSARTPQALARAAAALAGHLEAARDGADGGAALADAAFTLTRGRRPFRFRRSVVGRDAAAGAAALRAADEAGPAPEAAPATPPPVVFLFPGQGSQHPHMASEVYAEEPVFRGAVDECCDLLQPELGFDLRRALFPLAGEEARAAERLADTAVTQPALFVVEHALARLWSAWGVRPAAMLGHSLGEYVAACLAGVFTLEQALPLVAARGRLMAAQPPGDMLAAGCPEEQVTELLADEPEVALAAVNAPASCVVSGPRPAVERFAARLAEAGVEGRLLHTSHAFHSPMMEPVLAPFAELVAAAGPRPPRVPFVSNLTGTWIRAEEATDPQYWARQLRSPVRFAAGLATLLAGEQGDGSQDGGAQDGGPLLLEVGPGRSLGRLARQHPLRRRAAAVASSLPHARDAESGLDHLLAALGTAWEHGVEVDWEAFWAGQRRRRVPLPTYPFERRRFWVDGFEAAPAAAPAPGAAGPEPPAGEVEEAVAAVWHDVLGVDGIGRHDDFFDLGGSSLAGVQLGARLGERFGVELPSDLLLESTTVAALAASIAARSGQAAEGAAPAAPSCLVKLTRPTGEAARQPLFLVHQVGGHVFTFRDLARGLGPEQPLYALRSRGLEAGEEPLTTIEEMAGWYLELVRAEQARGPYWIGGASMGGMVAFEMAHQLAAAGETVALLTLMDTPCLDQMPAREDNADPVCLVVRERTGLTLDAAALAGLPVDERFARAAAAVREAGLDERWNAEEARRLARVIDANVEALYAYQPRPWDGRALFFRAAERRRVDPPRPELPWIELARGGTETVVVPGDHESMHQPPHVEVLAAHLADRLEAVRRAPRRARP